MRRQKNIRLAQMWYVLVPLQYNYARGIVTGIGHYVAGLPSVRLAVGDTSGLDRMLIERLGPVISFFKDAKHQQTGVGVPFPVINVSAQYSDAVLPRVASDHRAEGRMAAEHLLATGYRHFAFLARTNLWLSRLRRQGFCEALTANGHTCLPIENAAEPQRELTRMDKPLAIFVDGDEPARRLLFTCRDIGLHVPADVAVVSVDNDPVFCEAMTPRLSSVDCNAEKVGFEAARLMHEMLLGRSPPKEPVLVQPKGVVVRESSDAVAVDAPALARAVSFLRQHACDNIAVGDVASAARIPVRTLYDLCRRRLNTDVSSLIRTHRIERARRLLTDTDRTVADVAESCGFSHPGRFHILFRRLTGLSPAEFRNQRRLR